MESNLVQTFWSFSLVAQLQPFAKRVLSVQFLGAINEIIIIKLIFIIVLFYSDDWINVLLLLSPYLKLMKAVLANSYIILGMKRINELLFFPHWIILNFTKMSKNRSVRNLFVTNLFTRFYFHYLGTCLKGLVGVWICKWQATGNFQ